MKLSSGARRALYGAAGALILFGIVGFLVLPPIVRTQAEKRLSAALGRTVSIGKVRMDPYALSLTLEDVDIRERDGSRSFLGWARLYVRFDALASLTGDWVLGAIELDGFHAGIVANSDGSFNFSDLVAKFAVSPAVPSKPGRPIRIGHLNVSGARVDFSDRSLKTPFSTEVGPLTFELTDFRTVGDRGAPYHFEAVTDAAERLVWSGTLSADPVESRGEFEVQNLVLKKYSPYFEGMTRADLGDGTLNVHGRYEANFGPKKRVLTLSGAEVHLRSLKVLERSTGRTAAELKALDVTGLRADALALTGSADQVAVTGGHLMVRREKDGSVNLLSLLKPAFVASAPAGAASRPVSGPMPQVTVGEVAVRDSAVDVDDEFVPHAAELSLNGIQFSLKNFTLSDGATMPLHLTLSWAPKGDVQVDGTVALKPAPQADLKVKVVALDVLPLSPYLEQRINARITGGAFSTATSLHASISGGRVAAELEGDISMDALGLVDAAHNEGLAGFAHLAFDGLKAATEPQLAVSINEIDLGDPYARVRIDADKSLNLSTLLAAGAPPSAAPPPPAAAPAPKIEVGRVVISGGNLSFSDHSVEPNVHVSLGDFGGSIAGLSSENLERADVELKGTVDGTGPVEISGKLDPLGVHRFVGLKIDVANVDLLFLSPYLGKYAGYELERGQLVVDSKILVDGDAVDSTNVVTLKQFTFGAATASPDATALPVRLGVALLKDTAGQIVIDLPVQGSMDNPDFRIGKVVLRVIVNLLTKAAVSPFSLVGAMFGGGGDELAFQEFVPGSSALQPSELPKLETLAKALANRPALSLGLEGSYDPAADAYALKRSKLAGLVRRKIWEPRHALSPDIPPPDELVISPDENAAMVKSLFDSKFPPGTQFGTPLPPPPAVVPPPVAKPGFFRHIVDLVTFKGERDRSAAEKETARVAAQHEENVAKAVATGLPLDQMTGRLAESMDVTSNDLGALAAARARNVRAQLIEAGHIAPDRLFLSQGADQAKAEKGPRVLLTLQ
jgi:hypothetical protein